MPLTKKSYSAIAVAVIAIIVIAGVVYYLSQPPPVPTGPSKIKVGILVSLTGGLASIGMRHRIEHEEAITKLNGEGGIYVDEYKKNLPIEMVLVDDQSSPQYASEIVSKLILGDQVNFVLTSSYAHISGPMAKVAEKLGAVILVMTPTDFFAAQGPWTTAWCYFYSYASVIDGWISFLSKYKDQTNKKVGIVLSDDIIGRTENDLLKTKLNKAGYSVFDPGLYPPGTTDFTSVIAKLISEDCQILFIHGNVPTFAAFWRQSGALGYKPKVAYVSGALGLPSDAEALGGDLALGLLSYRATHPAYPFPYAEEMQGLREKYIKYMNIDLGYSVGYVFNLWLILKDAVQRAGTLDREKVNKALGETDFLGPCGRVYFDPATHCGYGVVVIGQWRKTTEGKWELEPVWSEVPEVPLINPIFPIP